MTQNTKPVRSPAYTVNTRFNTQMDNPAENNVPATPVSNYDVVSITGWLVPRTDSSNQKHGGKTTEERGAGVKVS